MNAGNLDYAVDKLFMGSDDELIYGSVRIQPIVFQDDIVGWVEHCRQHRLRT